MPTSRTPRTAATRALSLTGLLTQGVEPARVSDVLEVAADEIAAALQAHSSKHGADADRIAVQSPATNSLKLLRQARERLGDGLRARRGR